MRNVSGWSLVALMVLSGVASAQRQPVRPNVQPQPGQQQPGRMHTSDQQIAAVIATCNRTEVAAAKFALGKLKSDDAKEIATMLIKDHTEAAAKFGKWAGQAANVNTGAKPEEKAGDNEEARTPPVTAPAAGNQPRIALKPATAHLDWVALHQEMADEGLQACVKELSKYEGADFDKAFLGHQIGGHLMTAANLKVLKRHASSELGTEIDSAIEATESHLKKIRDLMNEKKDK